MIGSFAFLHFSRPANNSCSLLFNEVQLLHELLLFCCVLRLRKPVRDVILRRHVFNGNAAILLFLLVVVEFYVDMLSTLIKLWIL